MKEKKGVNYSVIAVAVVAVALVAVAAVLGIKMHNGSSIPAVAPSDTQPAPTYSYEPATDSIFSSIATTIAQVVSDNTVTVPESRTQAQTNPAKTTTPATKPADVTVPQLNEEDLSHASAGSNQNVVTPSGNLPQDMSFAGLMRLGYNVIGLKEYIYNNDTDPNCTQRKFGYNSLYDAGAGLIDFTIDTVKLPFTYKGKAYRIQLWKGQYISGKLGTVGGEVGLYTRPVAGNYDHYNCAAEEDWLNMEMTVFWNEFNDGVYLPQLTRNYSVHWWQTGYVDGQLKNKRDSSDLRIMSRITFKDAEQAAAFGGALAKNGFTNVSNFNPEVPDTYKVYGKDVILIWQDAR